MKTSIIKFGHLCLSLVFCLGLTACNQEDYYKKEYLDNPYHKEPTPNEWVDEGDQGGSNPDEGTTQGGVDNGIDDGSNGGTEGDSTNGGTTGDGGTHGGVDGSTTGGTVGGIDGSTQGSSTGGSVGGSTTGGSTTGGSTTGGSTTGGSTTGGSTTGGSTTGGSTTGGSTTGGSTTGDSTTGGSTTGGSTGCKSNNGHGNNLDGVDSSNPGSSHKDDPSGSIDDERKGCSTIVENFKQTAEENKKLDIVWVIDNSGSMNDEQDALGRNFNAFIKEFINRNVDFKMAITTTDTRKGYKGVMVPGSEEKLNSDAAKRDSSQFINDFMTMVKVGTRGSGNEKGLEATEGFMNLYAQTFLRSDAYLAVVIVSDEEDQSPKLPEEYAAILKSNKAQSGLVKVYSIVDTTLSNSGSGVTTGFERYAKVSESTAGTVADIREDFYNVLTDMGNSIINLLDSFALAHKPVPGSLKVYVNGELVNNYTFDEASSSIKFDHHSLPPVGADIKVTYLK